MRNDVLACTAGPHAIQRSLARIRARDLKSLVRALDHGGFKLSVGMVLSMNSDVPPSHRGWAKLLILTSLNDTARGIKDDTLTLVAELEVHLNRAVAPPSKEGFDEKLFVVQPVTGRPCSICFGVMNDPVSCPEGHR